jgi:hypothetical protein
MKRETTTGLIAVVAIAVVVMFVGCVEEKTSTPIPTPTVMNVSGEYYSHWDSQRGGYITIWFETNGDIWLIDINGYGQFGGRWQQNGNTVTLYTTGGTYEWYIVDDKLASSVGYWEKGRH